MDQGLALFLAGIFTALGIYIISRVRALGKSEPRRPDPASTSDIAEFMSRMLPLTAQCSTDVMITFFAYSVHVDVTVAGGERFKSVGSTFADAVDGLGRSGLEVREALEGWKISE